MALKQRLQGTAVELDDRLFVQAVFARPEDVAELLLELAENVPTGDFWRTFFTGNMLFKHFLRDELMKWREF